MSWLLRLVRRLRGGRKAARVAREEPVDRRVLLERMCAIERKWEARGISLDDLLFYGEHSGIAYREIGDLWEEAFFDAAEWIDLAGKAGVEGSACRELGGD